MVTSTLGVEDLVAARARIADAIGDSPCPRSLSLSERYGCRLHLKLENLQPTGSFKGRGALNCLLMLPPEERARGVSAASAGNHAQGIAYHARSLGIAARVVMPLGTPLAKVSATRRFGAEVVLHGSNYDEAYLHARELSDQDGRVLIHAFDDARVIAGQGSVGLELLEQVPDVQDVIVPVGGGGLIGGVGLAIKERRPDVRLIGVQSAALPSMRESLAAGAIQALPPAVTIADGIAVKRPGELTFPLVQRYVDELVTVDDEDVATAIMLLLEREKTLAEGAGAVGLAAIHAGVVDVQGRKAALVISGGNIDMTFLSRVIERGLVQDGRLIQLNVRMTDQPGCLAALTKVLGELRVNVLQIEHNRAFRHVNLGLTEVELALETRGQEHVEELRRVLAERGYEVHD
ncbi:MAG: threonine ammonia-lyase [Planctomycetota bacterium]